jgi:DNA (cytosine-5)-methyltransferase 1
MKIGSLFSGAGGLDMAVEAVFGGETVWHAEIDKAASKVLAYRYPNVPNLGDIVKVNWNRLAVTDPVDVICGGFPCQDVSLAGRRAGLTGDSRSGLWAEMARIIGLFRPQFVVIENVRGLLSAEADRDVEPGHATMGNGSARPVLRALGAVLGDLCDLGYDAQWATVAAGDVGAPHRRERVFIVADRGRDVPHPGHDARRPEHGVEHQVETRRSRQSSTELAGDLELLPTPTAQAAKHAGDSRFGGGNGDASNLWQIHHLLLPTPTCQDGKNTAGPSQFQRNTLPLNVEVTLAGSTAWGKYEPAIRRWEQLTRSAPPPTEPNKNGNPRLAAAFSEWLMGWPEGWVTDPAIGISRNDQLRIVGNGVCPQQAAAALRYLLEVTK